MQYWGIFPLTMSDYPAEVIAREDLSEVRIYTEDTAVEDALSGFVYVIAYANRNLTSIYCY